MKKKLICFTFDRYFRFDWFRANRREQSNKNANQSNGANRNDVFGGTFRHD